MKTFNSSVSPYSCSIACVIVTYNPDFFLLQKLINQLLKATRSVYIVDNYYSAPVSRRIRNLISENHLSLIPCIQNLGIAKAFNLGIEAAKKDSHPWVMLFDQDSVPQDGLIEEMEMAAKRIQSEGEQVAAIGPRLYDPRSKQFLKFAFLKWGIWKKVGCEHGNQSFIPCEFINASGSLIFLDLWQKIGPFRDELFIDHVETEWYMRIRGMAFKCYGYCSRSYLEHHMGDDVCRYWLGKWRWMPHRSPQRHYTIVRNALWLWRYDYTPMSWKINSLVKVIFTLLYFSIFDGARKDQFRYIMRGIRDGVLSK